jgi:hypothetical protein
MASAAPRVRLRVESDPWHVGVWRKSMVPTDLDDQLAALEIEPEHSGARLRTVTEPPSGEGTRAAGREHSGVSTVTYDQQLLDAEEKAGERAHSLIVHLSGVLGAPPRMRVDLVTAPDGPATPPEDIWSSPVTLAQLEAASEDSVRARVAWVLDATERFGLRAPTIEERYHVASHGFFGSPDALPLLLDARLARVKMTLPEHRVLGVACAVDEATKEIVCAVELEPREERQNPIVCELLRQPMADLDPSVPDVIARWAMSSPGG